MSSLPVARDCWSGWLTALPASVRNRIECVFDPGLPVDRAGIPPGPSRAGPGRPQQSHPQHDRGGGTPARGERRVRRRAPVHLNGWSAATLVTSVVLPPLPGCSARGAGGRPGVTGTLQACHSVSSRGSGKRSRGRFPLPSAPVRPRCTNVDRVDEGRPWIEGRLRRHWLDETSWVDLAPGWVRDADEIYATLLDTLPWREARLWRYDHYVIEPRLSAGIRPHAHPALLAATKALRAHYRVDFEGPALALYRDGRDALGPHRDRELRHTSNTLIAILTLGARRPWVVQPRGASRLTTDPRAVDLSPSSGDLLVL